MVRISGPRPSPRPDPRAAGSSSTHASLAPGGVDHEDEAMPSEQAGAASAHVPGDAAPAGPPDPITQTPAYPPPTGPEHGREFRSDEDGDGPTGTEAEGVAYAETLAEAKRAADERLRAALAACPLSGKVMRRGEHVEYLTTRVSPPERARAGWADDPPPSAYRRAAGAVILVRTPPDHAAAPTGGEAGSSSSHAEAEDDAELDGGVEPWAIAEMEEREAARARQGQQQAGRRRRPSGDAAAQANSDDDEAFLREPHVRRARADQRNSTTPRRSPPSTRSRAPARAATTVTWRTTRPAGACSMHPDAGGAPPLRKPARSSARSRHRRPRRSRRRDRRRRPPRPWLARS